MSLNKIKKLLEQNSLFSDLFNQIKTGNFKPITSDIEETLDWEGYFQETNDYDMLNYSYIVLDIPDTDVEGLVNMEDSYIDKYNNFDIELKKKLGLDYIDLINYDDGTIKIIKHGN